MHIRPITMHPNEIREAIAGRLRLLLRPVHPQPVMGERGGWYPRAPAQPFRDGPERHYASESHMRRGLAADFGPVAPGDRLWVRETWGIGCRPCPLQGSRDGIEYRADEELLEGSELLPLYAVANGPDLGDMRPGWRSPATMPRWASRLLVEVEAIRPRRLHELSDEDAQQAGVERRASSDPRYIWLGAPERRGGHRAHDIAFCHQTAHQALLTHWDHRHRVQAPSAGNPWAWEITIKRIEQE